MTEVRPESGGSAGLDRSEESSGAGSTLEAKAEERTYPITIIAVLVTAVITVWHAAVMLRGFFWQDDFLYVYRAAIQPLFDYVMQGYNGHMMPGQFLLVWLVTRWAPLNWVSAVLPVIALQLVAYVLFWRLLLRLFGYRWEILVPFAIFVASPLTFAASTWWAYALQIVPFQVALAGALYSHVGYLQTGDRKHAVHGVLWTVGGLLFWEKALLIVPVIVAVTAALQEGGLVKRAVATWNRHRMLWFGYGLVATIYVVFYSRAATAADGLTSSGRDIADLADRMLLDTFLPGVLGGPWQAEFFEDTPLQALPPVTLLAISAGIAGVLVVAGLWVGRTRAVVAWTLLAIYLACEVALVAAFRLHAIGPVIGGDVRYVADAVLVAALCGALAFLRPRDPAAAAPAAGRTGPTLVALGFGSVFLACAMLTMAIATPRLGHDEARDYVRTATEELRAQPGTVLYDGPVPSEIMTSLFGADARTSRVIGSLDLDVAFDRPTDDLQMLDRTGTPRPVILSKTTRAPAGPVPNCGYQANQFSADIAFESEPPEIRQVLRIGYFTNRSTVGTVIVGELRVRVTFEAGLHRLYLTVPKPGQIVSVDLAGSQNTVCVTDVVVGSPRPQAS